MKDLKVFVNQSFAPFCKKEGNVVTATEHSIETETAMNVLEFMAHVRTYKTPDYLWDKMKSASFVRLQQIATVINFDPTSYFCNWPMMCKVLNLDAGIFGHGGDINYYDEESVNTLQKWFTEVVKLTPERIKEKEVTLEDVLAQHLQKAPTVEETKAVPASEGTPEVDETKTIRMKTALKQKKEIKSRITALLARQIKTTAIKVESGDTLGGIVFALKDIFSSYNVPTPDFGWHTPVKIKNGPQGELLIEKDFPLTEGQTVRLEIEGEKVSIVVE